MNFKQCSSAALLVAVLSVVLLFFAPLAMAQKLLNVNSATVEELAAVPGLNDYLAKKIVEYREEMGDIQTLDELIEIEGISRDLLGKLKDYLGLDAISGAECSC